MNQATLASKAALNWHQALKKYLQQLRETNASSRPPAKKAREAVAEVFY